MGWQDVADQQIEATGDQIGNDQLQIFAGLRIAPDIGIDAEEKTAGNNQEEDQQSMGNTLGCSELSHFAWVIAQHE